ncbi:MAG: hypothetical protein ACKOTB_11925 [Planctomycetia bacterium]
MIRRQGCHHECHHERYRRRHRGCDRGLSLQTAVATVVASLAAAGLPAAAETPTRLAYRFRPGEKVEMDVAHRALTETTIGATSQSTETATDSRKTWTVVAVDQEGRATLHHSVDDVTMQTRTSDRGELRWSSRGDEPAPPGYEQVKANLGVPWSRFVVDPAGRIVERRDLRPCPPSSTGDLVVVPLPEEPVTEGAEWTVPQEVVVELPGGFRKAVRTRLRYRLVAVRDGIATIRVDTTVLTPVDDPRVESRLLERIWNGTIEFDVDRGRVLSRSSGIDRRVVGFEGPESSVRYKSSLEERLVE